MGMISLSYIPSYVYVHPGYREKLADLQGTLKVPCNFITEFQGRTDPAINIDMHIFSACMQYGHKRIQFSRAIYKRLAHVHSLCKCYKISPFTCTVCTSCIIHSHVPCIHIYLLWGLYLVAVCSLVFK